MGPAYHLGKCISGRTENDPSRPGKAAFTRSAVIGLSDITNLGHSPKAMQTADHPPPFCGIEYALSQAVGAPRDTDPPVVPVMCSSGGGGGRGGNIGNGGAVTLTSCKSRALQRGNQPPQPPHHEIPRRYQRLLLQAAAVPIFVVEGTKVMARTIGKFDFDEGVHGVRFTSASLGLSAVCLSDGQIDADLVILKEDLDAVAMRMKAALSKRPALGLLPV